MALAYGWCLWFYFDLNKQKIPYNNAPPLHLYCPIKLEYYMQTAWWYPVACSKTAAISMFCACITPHICTQALAPGWLTFFPLNPTYSLTTTMVSSIMLNPCQILYCVISGQLRCLNSIFNNYKSTGLPHYQSTGLPMSTDVEQIRISRLMLTICVVDWYLM